eukprot:3472802-Prorocentrum_lima.AAC.1
MTTPGGGMRSTTRSGRGFRSLTGWSRGLRIATSRLLSTLASDSVERRGLVACRERGVSGSMTPSPLRL